MENNPYSYEFEHETTASFFDDLTAAVSDLSNVRRVYHSFQYILSRFLDDRTASSKLIFSGPFAKIDYLLKESGANWQLVKNANDARVRIRKSRQVPVDELNKSYLLDLHSICHFIAFVDKADIPDSLIRLFPKETETHHSEPHVLRDSMRMIVEKWDDTYVYGQIEGFPEEGSSRVNYVSGSRNYPYDWSYLKEMFYAGAQINLIRPSMSDDGYIKSELIIFEPDYLVNVTSVARCFTHYANSAFVSLIHKIESRADSQAILLGNFAGQLLDEELYGEKWPDALEGFNKRYNESVIEFFKHNALSMLTTEIDSRTFHSDAKRQALNIHRALSEVLPSALENYKSGEGIVEPSFFSEMLGLQGRMDFMQMDYRYVLEQKSGKGAFPYNGFITPSAAVEHNVQIQLYTLLFRYNYRDIVRANKYEIQPFLLYSKYENSLLRVVPMPEVIFNGVKIRNGIAWLEMRLTRPHAYEIYNRLTPQLLNQKKVDDNLWRNFQLPKLSRILGTIHNASELERTYFFRFMTFVSNEHVMSKLGNKTKQCSGFASTWQDSLLEKRLAGNIYDNLQLVYPAPDTKGEITYVELKFSDDIDNDMSNFRRGDIVILYPYDGDKEPDATRSMIMRCTISDITDDNRVVLILRHPQSDNRIFQHSVGKVWAIEHDFMESSYSGLYQGMFDFLKAPKSRRDLLLLQREPEVDSSLELKGDYKEFNDLALRVKRAKDFFIIIGPPGTGKTSFGLLNTLKEQLLEPNSSVLLMSYTNRAVDEMCCKLKEAGIDFIRIGGEMSASPQYRDNLITERISGIKNLAEVKRLLIDNRVYVGTTSSISAHQNLFQLKNFDLAIIDEASQILEPHLMGILSAWHGNSSAIKKFVMIGDHKQLPAVVQQTVEVSKVDEQLLQDIYLTDCRSSLFERLLRKYGDNPYVVYMLTKQGRMHPDISAFPNYTFYGGKLDMVPLPHQTVALPQDGLGCNGLEDMLRTRRIAFVNSELPENSPSDKVNQVEAEMVAATVMKIYEIEKSSFSSDETVGVIVPYRNQIAAIRKMIDGYHISQLHNITIDTVERFQGSQRRYILYGFTVQKKYQLNFLTSNVFKDIDGTIVDRKLNVAMTRAEEHLIMFGNSSLLRSNDIFGKLINYVDRHNGYFEVSKDDYVNGNFKMPVY